MTRVQISSGVPIVEADEQSGGSRRSD